MPSAPVPPVTGLPIGPAPDGVHAVADALEARLDALVQSTLATVFAEVPVYRERGGDVPDATRRAVAYVYGSFIEQVRSGQPPSEIVARSLAGVGADRAAQGIPLGDLLHGFRVSARCAAATLLEAATEDDLDRDATLWVMQALFGWVDTVSNLAAADYSKAQARLLTEADAAHRSFLIDLLLGAATGEAATDRAEDVGWDAAADYLVVVLGGEDGRAPRTLEGEVASALARSWTVHLGGRLVVLVPTPDRESAEAATDVIVVAATGAGWRVGCSRPRAGLVGVPRAYRESLEALTIALAVGDDLVRWDDAVLERLLLQDPDLLGELIDRTVGPLLRYDAERNAELVRTLGAWLAHDASPTRAADALHTHPQTIRYRLARIGEITGWDPNGTEGRLHLHIGLRAAQLSGTSERLRIHHQ